MPAASSQRTAWLKVVGISVADGSDGPLRVLASDCLRNSIPKHSLMLR